MSLSRNCDLVPTTFLVLDILSAVNMAPVLTSSLFLCLHWCIIAAGGGRAMGQAAGGSLGLVLDLCSCLAKAARETARLSGVGENHVCRLETTETFSSQS